MVWRNTPMVFWNDPMDFPKTKGYPVNVIAHSPDGSVLGTIDESKLTAVQHIILDEEEQNKIPFRLYKERSYSRE